MMNDSYFPCPCGQHIPSDRDNCQYCEARFELMWYWSDEKTHPVAIFNHNAKRVFGLLGQETVVGQVSNLPTDCRRHFFKRFSEQDFLRPTFLRILKDVLILHKIEILIALGLVLFISLLIVANWVILATITGIALAFFIIYLLYLFIMLYRAYPSDWDNYLDDI